MTLNWNPLTFVRSIFWYAPVSVCCGVTENVSLPS